MSPQNPGLPPPQNQPQTRSNPSSTTSARTGAPSAPATPRASGSASIRRYDEPEPTEETPRSIDALVLERARNMAGLSPADCQRLVESNRRSLAWSVAQTLPELWGTLTREILTLAEQEWLHPEYPWLSQEVQNGRILDAMSEAPWWLTTLPGRPNSDHLTPLLVQSRHAFAPGDRLALVSFADAFAGVGDVQSAIAVLHPALRLTDEDAAQCVLGAVANGSAFVMHETSLLALKRV